MTPQKLGLFIVAMCLAAYVGFYLAISKADASTALQPTARDWQRLNACSNTVVNSDVKPELQHEMSIKCAAWGKAVAHIESGNGKSLFAKKYLNGYGIMYWDKKGKRHIKRYKSTKDADMDWARIYVKNYKSLGYKAFATRWTGESHAVAHYSAFLKKWVPTYTTLYRQIAESK